jgi:threonine dehydrogenase-like Zn-dependent dehydrogenase
VTDVKEDRLELAKKLGATAAYRADDPNVVQNVRKHAPLNVSMEWYVLSDYVSVAVLTCLVALVLSPLLPWLFAALTAVESSCLLVARPRTI